MDVLQNPNSDFESFVWASSLTGCPLCARGKKIAEQENLLLWMFLCFGLFSLISL